jgi:hypothetical protein
MHKPRHYRYAKGILYFALREDVELGWAEADEITTVLMEVSEEKPVTILLDARVHFQVKEEGRNYFSRADYPSNLCAAAVVSTLLPVRMLVNFYLRINKPYYPTRLFSTMEEAEVWLQQYLGE